MSYLTNGLISGAVALAFAMPGMAAAEASLEGETVTVIVPFAEGGGADRLARILAGSLSTHLPGKPDVIVLNQPGGGSVTAANAFQDNSDDDGTAVFLASTSTFLPKMLGADVAKFDPTTWVAVAGFPRGATIYGYADQLGIKGAGADPKADLEGLKEANVRFGMSTPIAAELLDIVALNLMGAEPRVIFGMDSSEAEAAFLREEMNINTDNTLSYIKNFKDDPKVVSIWSYGVIDEDGTLKHDPDMPDLPTFEEFYQTATGEAPSGGGYELLKNLMNAKVMISKAVMLPPGTSDEMRQAYIDAMKAVVEEPTVRTALDKEVGHMPVNFGDATARAIASGTQMSPETRAWANDFLKEHYNTSLDGS